MTVRTNQTITPYGKDTLIKPIHPVWKIKNVGSTTMMINDVFPLVAGLEFGIDAMELVTPIIEKALTSANPGEKIEIVNDTQFSIKFVGGSGKALLFQTSFTIEK